MSLHPASWAALGCIAATIAVALWRRWPATGVLIAGNVVVFLLSLAGPQFAEQFLLSDGRVYQTMSPLVSEQLLFHSGNLLEFVPIGVVQLVSHQFLHADFLHLFGNMLMLFFLGLPFEERIGARRFVAIYLFAGLVGALAELVVALPGTVRMLGASGAVAGVIGAFAVSHPNQQVPMPVPAIFITFFVRMRVWIAAVLFVTLQFVYMYAFGGRDNTAYIAHIGGLLGGALMSFLIVRRSKEAGVVRPVAVDLKNLARFANDPNTQQVLRHMQVNHDEPAVFQAWLDRFFTSATCPTCQHKVAPRHQGEVVCTQGHRFDVRQAKA
ncbi:MAG: hypothetical protein QOD77_1383 [Thermoplasmata archaeon]|nr:hypothetical protein [Thermoplasmata archaeon]